MVCDISKDKVVTVMNREEGIVMYQAKAVILAMGCRERPRGALNIPGYRQQVSTLQVLHRDLLTWKASCQVKRLLS